MLLNTILIGVYFLSTAVGFRTKSASLFSSRAHSSAMNKALAAADDDSDGILLQSELALALSFRGNEVFDAATGAGRSRKITRSSVTNWERQLDAVAFDLSQLNEQKVLLNVYGAILKKTAPLKLDPLQLTTFQVITNAIVDSLVRIYPAKTPITSLIDEITEVNLNFIEDFRKIIDDGGDDGYSQSAQQEFLCYQFAGLARMVYARLSLSLGSRDFDSSAASMEMRVNNWVSPVNARLQRRFVRFLASNVEEEVSEMNDRAFDRMLQRVDVAVAPRYALQLPFAMPATAAAGEIVTSDVIDSDVKNSNSNSKSRSGGVEGGASVSMLSAAREVAMAPHYPAWEQADFVIKVLRNTVNCVDMYAALEAKVVTSFRETLAEAMKPLGKPLQRAHDLFLLSERDGFSPNSYTGGSGGRNGASTSSASVLASRAKGEFLESDRVRERAEAMLNLGHDIAAIVYVIWHVRHNIVGTPIETSSRSIGGGGLGEMDEGDPRDGAGGSGSDEIKRKKDYILPIKLREIRSTFGDADASIASSPTLTSPIDSIASRDGDIGRKDKEGKESAAGGSDGKPYSIFQSIPERLRDAARFAVADLNERLKAPLDLQAAAALSHAVRETASEDLRALITYNAVGSSGIDFGSGGGFDAVVPQDSINDRDAVFKTTLTAVLVEALTSAALPPDLLLLHPAADGGAEEGMTAVGVGGEDTEVSAFASDSQRQWFYESLIALTALEEAIGTREPRASCTAAYESALTVSILQLMTMRQGAGAGSGGAKMPGRTIEALRARVKEVERTLGMVLRLPEGAGQRVRVRAFENVVARVLEDSNAEDADADTNSNGKAKGLQLIDQECDWIASMLFISPQSARDTFVTPLAQAKFDKLVGNMLLNSEGRDDAMPLSLAGMAGVELPDMGAIYKEQVMGLAQEVLIGPEDARKRVSYIAGAVFESMIEMALREKRRRAGQGGARGGGGSAAAASMQTTAGSAPQLDAILRRACALYEHPLLQSLLGAGSIGGYGDHSEAEAPKEPVPTAEGTTQPAAGAVSVSLSVTASKIGMKMVVAKLGLSAVMELVRMLEDAKLRGMQEKQLAQLSAMQSQQQQQKQQQPPEKDDVFAEFSGSTDSWGSSAGALRPTAAVAGAAGKQAATGRAGDGDGDSADLDKFLAFLAEFQSFLLKEFADGKAKRGYSTR